MTFSGQFFQPGEIEEEDVIGEMECWGVLVAVMRRRTVASPINVGALSAITEVQILTNRLIDN